MMIVTAPFSCHVIITQSMLMMMMMMKKKKKKKKKKKRVRNFTIVALFSKLVGVVLCLISSSVTNW